jgi:acyl-CoA thioesterase-1
LRLLRQRAVRLALLACVLALAACGKSPQLARLGADDVVLAFGDSLTYGTGASEHESYPAQLAQLIGRRVVQAGVPGEVSAHALQRLPAELDEVSPRLLLLCIGGNDFLRRLDRRQAVANVRAMVRMAKARHIDVVLIGTPEPGLTVTPPAFYAEIAEEFAIPYLGEAIGYVLRRPDLKSDPIHPNAKGYRLIAERLAEVLHKSGALAPGE